MNRRIDFHSHVLPGMDDGSDSLETTSKLLGLLSDQEISTVCATSHYYRRRESIEQYLARRAEAVDSLESKLHPEFPEILLGAEVAFFSGMAEEEMLPGLCLGKTRTLLLEMPFTDWSSLVCDEVIHMALDRNFCIVLAHPERYSERNGKALERFAQAGVGFQVNADTLLHWGSRKAGIRLLEMTSFPALGTDCHNLTSRAPHMEKARKFLRKKLGDGFLQTLDSSMNALIQNAEAEVLL